MAEIRPFCALRPRGAELAARVASVPYDVVDTEEARDLAAGRPESFLHVVRPEIDLPTGTDIHADEVYAQGKLALDRLREERILVRDEEPALYLYRQRMGEHSQIGVVACGSVDEYDEDRIKKHERTRQDKEDDRTRHVLTLSAHAGPVFLTYRGTARIDSAVAGVVSGGSPLYDFVAPDGVGHTVWKVPDASELVAAFREVPALYVADGHHRAASASRARAVRREEAGTRWTGDEEVNRFLTVLFPGDQLRILPYNRVVHDLQGFSPAGLIEELREVMDVSREVEPSPDRRGRFGMYLAGSWIGLEARREALENPDPVASLDAAILQDQVLGPLLGISDPRTSKRIDFVGGIRGTGELERRIDALGGGAAFSLYPVSVEQLLAVADAGRVLPPKSTWFEPKLRSGLLVHEF